MEIRLRLDDKVDADLVAEIKKMANSGPASKVLYRIVLEWYLLRKNDFVPKNRDFAAGQNEPVADQGQNDNNIIDVLSAIDEGW